MFDLNNKTVVNRSFKIREIFKMINADKDLKRDAEVIKKINLANVISKETLNIKSNESCREIYVILILYLSMKMSLKNYVFIDMFKIAISNVDEFMKVHGAIRKVRSCLIVSIFVKYIIVLF